MTILFLTRRFYPDIGGVERHVYKIAKELTSRGFEVKVLTELPPKNQHNKKKNYQSIGQSDTHSINFEKPAKSSYSATFSFNKIEVNQIEFGENDWFKKFRIWAKLFEARKEFRDADIIHCHDVFFGTSLSDFLYPDKKVFTTFHGYEGYPIGIKNIVVRKLSEFLSNGSICVGKFIKKWYFAEPDYIIYGAADQKSGSELKIKRKPSALFYGRLDKQSGVEEYTKAFLKIVKKVNNFKFSIIGEGPYLSKVKDNVISTFIADLENELVKYRFAFVSSYLSILEALSLKKLVFALYSDPVKKDYLLQTPFSKFIVVSSSPKDLARKVLYYLSRPEGEKKMVDKGYTWVRKQTWKKLTDLYIKLWQI